MEDIELIHFQVSHSNGLPNQPSKNNTPFALDDIVRNQVGFGSKPMCEMLLVLNLVCGDEYPPTC